MSISGNFRFSKGRVYFDLWRDDVTDDDKVTIKVIDDEGDHYHTKHLPPYNEFLTLDLTPYCKAYLTGELKYMLKEGGEANWHNLSVVVSVEEANNGQLCDGYNLDGWGILTKLPYLQISKGVNGSVDPLLMILRLPDDSNVEICTRGGCEQIQDEGNCDLVMYSVFVETPEVKIFDTDGIYEASDFLNSYLPVRTVPRGINTRRLVWRNEMGGVDAWSFEFLRESTFAATSEVFYSTIKGYTRTNRQYERVNIIETREVDEKVASALAYITASPEVYLYDYEREDYIPIDIITEECRTYSDTELTSIQIAYRPKEREVL